MPKLKSGRDNIYDGYKNFRVPSCDEIKFSDISWVFSVQENFTDKCYMQTKEITLCSNQKNGFL